MKNLEYILLIILIVILIVYIFSYNQFIPREYYTTKENDRRLKNTEI